MNKSDRKRVAEILEQLEVINSEIEDLSVDIETRIENIEEYFPDSDKIEKLQEEADALTNAYNAIDEAINEMEVCVG